MKNCVVLFLFAVLFSACTTNKTVIMWVEGVDNSFENDKNPSFQVQKNNKVIDSAWINLQTSICGFEYEPGYLYQLEVKKNMPKKDGTYDFNLVEIKQKFSKNREQIFWKDSLAQKWILLSYIDSSGNEFLIDETIKSVPFIVFNMDNRRMNGWDGCNKISSTIEYLTGNQIELGMILSTKRGCINYQLPEQFIKLLRRIKFYKIEDSTLQLMDKNYQLILTFVEQ